MKKLIKVIIFVIIFLLVGYLFILVLFPNVYLNHLYQMDIRDENDKPLYSIIQNSMSDYTKLDNISEEFKNTIVTVEDKRFYSHHGLDYARIIKSFYENIKNNEITQGGSTISQQLARMAYLDNSKTYTRKISEALYAKKIEETYSKDQILEMYINNCYFAHNLYGISASSNYYFNKLPSELNYSESAILVGIINAPNLYAPDIDYDACLEKRKQILYLLYENDVIDINTYYFELDRPINLYLKTKEEQSNLMYYQDALQTQLKGLNLYEESYLRQGLKVESYLDIDIYNKVNGIIKKYQKEAKNDEISVVIMKPYSNKVITLIGGFDYQKSPYNRALNSKRQIGSTIKPFLYYLGLKEGMTPLSKFTSEETTFNIEGVGLYSPKNASGFYANRKINMVEALSLSDNIYAIKTTLLVGSSTLGNLLQKFGINCENVNPTIGLGSISLSPLELTSLYNCLASEGIYYRPSFIKSVKLQDGTILKNARSNYYRVLDNKETIIINHLLKSPFDTALASYAFPSLGHYQTTHTFGAKTGSTASTNWVMGFNPNYTIGVYVGNDDNEELNSTKLARILFKEIANSISEGKQDTFYKSDSLKGFTFYNNIKNQTSKVYYR